MMHVFVCIFGGAKKSASEKKHCIIGLRLKGSPEASEYVVLMNQMG